MNARPGSRAARGIPPESQALLQILQPHCMLVMAALERLAGPEGGKVMRKSACDHDRFVCPMRRGRR